MVEEELVIEEPVFDDVVIEEPVLAEEAAAELSRPASVAPSSPELSFDDVVVEVEVESPVSERGGFGLDLIHEEPASSRRAHVATSMDEALAGAAAHLEPPPASEPAPAVAAPAEPARPESVFPTTEQLGQTVALEEGSLEELELDEPLSEAEEPELDMSMSPEAEQLEADLPAAGGGAYDAALASPPEARQELERVRLGQVQADVVARPLISTNVVDFVNASSREHPGSFLELLDQSLSLG